MKFRLVEEILAGGRVRYFTEYFDDQAKIWLYCDGTVHQDYGAAQAKFNRACDSSKPSINILEEREV